MLAVRTPGAPRATRSVARPAIPPSPLRDRVGYSDHVRFRGYFPVHFIPAYNLPVYASRWPLPDTTHVYAEVDMEMKAKALASVDISGLRHRPQRGGALPSLMAFLKRL